MSKKFIQDHTNQAFSQMRANRKRSSEQEAVLKKIQEDLVQEQLVLKMQQANLYKEMLAFKAQQQHAAYAPPPPYVQEAAQIVHDEEEVSLAGLTCES